MLFNSFEFLLLFLPFTLLIYFTLTHFNRATFALNWLTLASIFFYGCWNPKYVILLAASMLINYFIGESIKRAENKAKSLSYTTAGVAFNILMLGYFKYSFFIVSNFNTVFDAHVQFEKIILPLGISFITFQKIGYLIDLHRNIVKAKGFKEFVLFVCFFPQLIAGPIVHYKELMPQFSQNNLRFNFTNFNLGFFIFSIGLIKKVLIADTFARWANKGFGDPALLSILDAWLCSYSYTFQLYFDFSGYSDMAIGLAMMMNIQLPLNFNSPYKACSITDLWQRWHMTLTRFINLYIYKTVLRMKSSFSFPWAMVSIIIAMTISGLWHGAAWTFVIFGALQGVAMVIAHLWRRNNLPMRPLFGWLLTFHFFSLSLVIFRGTNWENVAQVFSAMFGLNHQTLLISPNLIIQDNIKLINALFDLGKYSPAVLSALAAGVVFAFILFLTLLPNTHEIGKKFNPNFKYAFFQALLICVGLIMMMEVKNEFIYFQF